MTKIKTFIIFFLCLIIVGCCDEVVNYNEYTEESLNYKVKIKIIERTECIPVGISRHTTWVNFNLTIRKVGKFLIEGHNGDDRVWFKKVDVKKVPYKYQEYLYKKITRFEIIYIVDKEIYRDTLRFSYEGIDNSWPMDSGKQ